MFAKKELSVYVIDIEAHLQNKKKLKTYEGNKSFR